MKSTEDIENELRPWFRNLSDTHPAVKVLWAVAVARKVAEERGLPITPQPAPGGGRR